MNQMLMRYEKSVVGRHAVFSKLTYGLALLSFMVGSVQTAVASGYIWGGLSWTSVSNLPTTKIRHASATVEGKIYTIGGADVAFSPSVSTVNIYDPSHPTQGWGSVSNLPNNVMVLAAASVSNKIWFFRN